MEYEFAATTNYQLGAIMYDLAAEYWRAISTSHTGFVWNTLEFVDADGKAENYRSNVADRSKTAKLFYLSLGRIGSEIRNTADASINAEIDGDETDG